jgi:hypothetical protein
LVASGYVTKRCVSASTGLRVFPNGALPGMTGCPAVGPLCRPYAVLTRRLPLPVPLHPPMHAAAR